MLGDRTDFLVRDEGAVNPDDLLPARHVQHVTASEQLLRALLAEDGGYLFDGQPTGEDHAETQLYRKAVQIVAESQKASTSYLQRQLRVGYNSAARLIERMEKDGLVGQPDHVGRREVLIDMDGHPI